MKTIQWKDKVIYQIFPRSFKDSNNDGDGDIQGIISKLDYLQDLGITAIWLSPTYETEFADAGYDVLDYKSVWKQFGTLEDFKEMVAEAKKRNIDIIMDIVLNHVSNKHDWFKKACESVDNVEHNYFIWREELNNDEKDVQSLFGGSAWEFVPSVNKYYFHLFAVEQVDLNWNHKDTVAAMADIISFWYDMGVRGFRMDAIKHVDKQFPEGVASAHSWQKDSVKQLKALNKIAFADKPDAFTFGEASGVTLDEALKYGTGKDKVADNYYNFSWWWIGWGHKHGRNDFDPNWDFKNFQKQMSQFQENEKITPELMTNFLSNHDTARAVSRWGSEDKYWQESAKAFTMMLFVLKGIPCILQGEEIGMLNPRFKGREEFRDVDALNHYKRLVDSEKVFTEEEMTKYHNINGRDNSRTPVQWDDTQNSGFNSGHKPWIKVGYKYKDINVKAQVNDPDSIYTFTKNMIALRSSDQWKDVLVDGTSKFTIVENDVFKINRKHNDKQLTAIINITDKQRKFNIPNGKVLLSSYTSKNSSDTLRPFETLLIETEK